MSAEKLLSICTLGRDDDYEPDLRYRFATVINHFAKHLRQLGQLMNVEMVVTDWGSRVPLAKVLRLSAEARQMCRFVYVPREVVLRIQNGADAFHFILALNTALRRAAGKFMMTGTSDVIMTKESLRVLIALLNGEISMPVDIARAYFMLSRYHIPLDFVDRHLSLDEWDRYLFLNATMLDREVIIGGGGTGALLAHRLLWYEMRGYDERYAGWGPADIDAGLRITEKYPWVGLDGIGCFVLHMDHSNKVQRKKDFQTTMNNYVLNLSLSVNDENWGLANYDFEIQSPETTHGKYGEEPSANRVPDPGMPGKDGVITNQSIARIPGELRSRRVREHVIGLKRIRVRLGRKLCFRGSPPDELPWMRQALFLLSWCGLYRAPRRFLAIGVKPSIPVVAMAAALRDLELYMVDVWDGFQHEYWDTPQGIAETLNKKVMHRGYMRFVNGDIRTSLSRLRESFVGDCNFDLVFVRGDLLEDAVRQMAEIINVVGWGGAVILTGVPSCGFDHLWGSVRQQFPDMVSVRCGAHSTGMFLKGALHDGVAGEARDMDVEFSDISILDLLKYVVGNSIRQLSKRSD